MGSAPPGLYLMRRKKSSAADVGEKGDKPDENDSGSEEPDEKHSEEGAPDEKPSKNRDADEKPSKDDKSEK